MRASATASLLTSLLLAVPLAAGGPECDWEATACVKYMIDNFENKGWIGIELDFAEQGSPTIVRVIDGSPAAAAGLLAADTLVAIDGVAYASATEEQLEAAKSAMVPGRDVRLSVTREGAAMDVTVTLGKVPPAILAQWIGSHLLEQHRRQFQTAEGD